MNWAWSHKQKEVLTDKATSAESRLGAIKKAAKALKKSVEDSLRTAPKSRGNEDLEARKRRTCEYSLGESVAAAAQVLNEERVAMNVPAPALSPLNMILERFANLEKTIGHMLASNELAIANFLSSDTPICNLLAEEIPAVAAAKKDLEQLCRRQSQSQNVLDKEQKKLDRMRFEENADPDIVFAQQEKKERLAFELETLTKDVSLEQDKLTSTLLTLVSRENRYALSVFELMRIKKQFYEDAFRTIEAELPNIERILQETNMRPVFGERIEDHLRATNRTIAFPIALTVRYLLDSGLNDEGLFRISPKQIKLDKFKAHLDSHQPLQDLMQDSDCHLHSSLLKSYLRELPVPLLGDRWVYDRWIAVAGITDAKGRASEIRRILAEKLTEPIVRNIQYVIKFLHELSGKCQTNKMTPRNISIVLGPTLLWSDRGFEAEQGNLENIISVVATLIESYHVIFPVDIDLYLEDEDLAEMRLKPSPGNLVATATASVVAAAATVATTTTLTTSLSTSSTSLPSPIGASRDSLASSPSPPEIPPRPYSICGSIAATATAGMAATNTFHATSSVPLGSSSTSSPSAAAAAGSGGLALPPIQSLSVDGGASPSHKRKASIRALGKNLIAKINVPTTSTSSSTTAPEARRDDEFSSA